MYRAGFLVSRDIIVMKMTEEWTHRFLLMPDPHTCIYKDFSFSIGEEGR